MFSMDINRPPPNLPVVSPNTQTPPKDTAITTSISPPEPASQHTHPQTIPSGMIHYMLTVPNLPLPKHKATFHPKIHAAGVVTIKLIFPQRSTPTPRARIYSLPTNSPALKAKWKAIISRNSQGKRHGKASELRDADGEDLFIGFILTGDFNLKAGGDRGWRTSVVQGVW